MSVLSPSSFLRLAGGACGLALWLLQPPMAGAQAQPKCLLPPESPPVAQEIYPAALQAGTPGGPEPLLFAPIEVPQTPEEMEKDLEKSALENATPRKWIDLPEIIGSDLIDTYLKISYVKRTIPTDFKNGKWETREVHLRNYVGAATPSADTLHGPVLRFRGGKGGARTLRVQLHNLLPCNGKPPGDPTCQPNPKCVPCDHSHTHEGNPNDPKNFKLNDTNFHTHGLHVSPKCPQDDVLLTLKPGCAHQVDVKIPADHEPGTFWYHAHRHGSTAVQLASGMAGPLILEGKVDQIPEIKKAKEEIFLFQQISVNSAGTLEDFSEIEADYFRINSQLKPRITLENGEVQRWRFINAGFLSVLPIRLVRKDNPKEVQDLHLIAIDGLTLPKRTPRKLVELSAGNRADVLVKLKPGVYRLVKTRAERISGTTEPPQDLAEVVVLETCSPGKCDMPLPDVLRDKVDFIEPSPGIKSRRLVFSFNEKNQPVIDGKPYDPKKIDQLLKLGTVEEWTIFNCSGEDHPFHIHVNPFQISEYTVNTLQGQIVVGIPNPKDRPWHDTFLIPEGYKKTVDGEKVIIPGYFKMLTKLTRFDGQFVLHCHILTHEDVGMMQNVKIDP